MNQSVSFFQRLKDARLNLGLNQTDFAQIGGVTKKTQMLYESGERAPDSTYLSAIAAAGADVLYILTGQRSQPLPAAPPINDRARLAAAIEAVESGLAETKRRLPSKQKAELVLAAYDLMAQPNQSLDNVIRLVRLAA